MLQGGSSKLPARPVVMILNGDLEAYLNAVTEISPTKTEYVKRECVRRAPFTIIMPSVCRVFLCLQCLFSRSMLSAPPVPRRFIVRLDYEQQTASDSFNGVIGYLHAIILLTAEC